MLSGALESPYLLIFLSSSITRYRTTSIAYKHDTNLTFAPPYIKQDGKKNPWEAVVLLPFIDEKRLLASEAQFCPADKLTADERARNAFGNVLTYRFDPTVQETYFSCNPEIGLQDVVKCSSICLESEPEYAPGQSFEPHVIEGTVSPLPGFPSLGVLSIVNVETEFQKVNTFGSESKYVNMYE